MRVRVPGYLIAAAVCVVLGPVASAGAVAQSPTRAIDPAAAARACATPRAHAGQPALAQLNRLVSCVLRAERKQLGLSYTPNAALSRMVDGALRRFIALPYLAQHHPQLVRTAEQRAGDHIVKSFCRGAGPGVSRGSWEFANRDALSTLQVAKDLAMSFQAADPTARAAAAKFGVAARTGLLFRHGYHKGISLGVIAVTCS